ncbi:MAG: hypothetical protein Q9O62_07620 [Ardenticatenia bacterium]|nr:hypothetical protein [Ardenticatenia bacterium]
MRTISRLWPVLFLIPLLTAAVMVMTACAERAQIEGPSVEERLKEAEQQAMPMPQVSSRPFLEFEQYRLLQTAAGGIEAPPVETYVLTRVEDLTAYPCSTCHVKPLDELQAESEAEGQFQHWEITLNHGDQTTMTCETCHNVNAEGEADSTTVDTLRTLTGEVVEFDASYQQCAQCHASAVEEWLGGAHGKRVGGWAEPRVLQNCADCHNPHDPRWDVRWPAVPPKDFSRGRGGGP